MKVLPRALFLMDFDGTLLDGSGQIPPRNLAAMRRAVEAGVALAIVTGRRRSTYRREISRLVGIPHRVSCSNGAVLLGEDNESIEIAHEIPWRGLVDVAHARRIPSIIRGIAVTVPPVAPAGEEEPDAWILDDRGRFHAAPNAWEPATHRLVEDVLPLSRPLVHAALHLGSRDEAESLQPWMQEAFGDSVEVHSVNVPRGDGALLEAVVPGGKGVAVRDLARLLDVPGERIAAIGDDMNDAVMLDAAGMRFVVGGSVLASRRPDAIATCPAGEGAVGDALDRFLAELG